MNHKVVHVDTEKGETKTVAIQQPCIEVCFGPACSDLGGRELAEQLSKAGYKSVAMGDCRSQCPNAPLVLVNNQMVSRATLEKVLAKIKTVTSE